MMRVKVVVDKLKKNRLFDYKATDDKSKRTIIKGERTGLFNLNEVKYSWARSMYPLMIGNFWVPEKVSGLGEDAIMYNSLSSNEKRAYKGILSFLIFLDSIQTVNLPNISDYITSPEVNLILAIQSYQEAIHSQSYTTILETVVDADERSKIYYFWKKDPMLMDRNKYIGDIYQSFINNPNDRNFFKVLVGNLILEGLYFYNGFAFFDTLVYNSKMIATGRMINYIRRDEYTHIVLFANIIKELKKEFVSIFDEEIIYNMFKEAVQGEIDWSNHILDGISGITPNPVEQYTNWLANERLELIKLKPLYPDVHKTPYKHLEAMSDNNSEKTNFFESTVVNYSQASSLNGSWDF